MLREAFRGRKGASKTIAFYVWNTAKPLNFYVKAFFLLIAAENDAVAVAGDLLAPLSELH